MKIPLLLLLGSLMSSSAQSPSPQTIVPREDLKAALRGLWSQSGVSCGKVNYDLYAYTEKHPERVKFAGEDEVAHVEGFVDYLASMSPITVPWAENGITVSLLFHEGKLLTPWGDEIFFLIDRNKDGYLTAFGEKCSVNHFADPWKLEGFQYSKAVGMALRKAPDFFQSGEGATILSLNDNDYMRLKDLVPRPQLRPDGSVSAPAAAKVKEADLEGPHKAASLFFAACQSEDLDALRKLVTRRQLEKIKRKKHTLEWWAGLWATYKVESIDGSEPIRQTPDGRAKTKVNFSVSTEEGKKSRSVTFSLEDNEWKMDEN